MPACRGEAWGRDLTGSRKAVQTHSETMTFPACHSMIPPWKWLLKCQNSCTMPSKKAGSRFTGFFGPGLMYIGQRSQLLWHHCSSCTCPAAVATKTRYPPAGMLQPCPHRLLQMCPGLSAEEHMRSACLCTDSRTELLPCVNTRMRTTLDSVFTHLCYVLLSTKSVNDDKGS